MPGRSTAAPAIAVALAAAAGAGCGAAGPPVEQVRALRLAPQALPPRPGGGRTVVRVAASVAPRRAGVAASPPPPVQVPLAGSIAIGRPNGGRLVNGLQLPAHGPYWATWDPIAHRLPNRGERRWATDRLLAFLVAVLRDYHLANPAAPPVLVGDLSRPFGGPFGRRFGGLGHASHQNGLDVDVLYPRADRALAAARRPQEVDRVLAQDLVNRFVGWGARFAFVGLHVGLRGPPAVVQAIAHHDDHVHVRIENARR